ncbi:MAG: fumarylacetoacetate hydrolase family protein [Minwuiales bacterium]|nr:fumarylacetoacetate hydrolase family protein [Minwuiales bacterium]
MSDNPRIEAAAAAILNDHKAGIRFGPLTDHLRPADVDEAYAVQDALHRLLTADGRGPIAGYKIALTSAAMQQMVGIDRPCAGAVFAETVHRSPADLSETRFMHLGVECEIAVRLGRALPVGAAPFDRTSVSAAVAECMPSFELVEDRNADYGSLDAPSLIADNCWNAGVVLGRPVADWQTLDLVGAKAVMSVDGSEVASGLAGDAMGHPLDVVAWLANFLAGRRVQLEAGMIVMTGSVVPTQFLPTGASVSFAVDGLGEAMMQL